MPFDWTPGLDFSEQDVDELLPRLPEDRRAEVVAMMRELHAWVGKDSPPVDPAVREAGGWDPAYDMQPDKPFPERG